MKTLFPQKDIFLIGGPGGVGKTTLAAALGVQLATAGYKTVVLTVDPAKRLAQALGFRDGFSSELQEVTLPGAPGKLFASMLDTQTYFDRVIDRFATRPQQKERLKNNPLYRVTIETLGGTHEYAAMERLLEFAKEGDFEKLVVDTPPTQNAVDLLSAPQRLADFMDTSVLRWFQGPKPVYLQIFRQGTKIAMKLIQKIFGAQFMETLAKFFDDLEGMQAGFRQRNLEVIELLRSTRTAFLLVTYPSEMRYLESLSFLETLGQNKIPLAALILNRIEPGCGSETSDAQINAVIQYYNTLAELQRQWIAKFKSAMPEAPTFLVTKQVAALHDVNSLSQLGRFLIS